VTPSTLVLREAARHDISGIVGYYAREATQDVAFGFIDGLEQAFDHILCHPEAGSPRYAQELGLPGLRHWVLAAYPYLIFYRPREDHIDVWRVLHAERDIPAWMREG
jgi:toxin ParE1/3/4